MEKKPSLKLKKTFCFMKRHHWENELGEICGLRIWQKACINIYKELLKQLKKKTQTIQLMRIHSWQMSMWKDVQCHCSLGNCILKQWDHYTPIRMVKIQNTGFMDTYFITQSMVYLGKHSMYNLRRMCILLL